ncbi:MAG: hypothetical protein AAB362_01660 [Patescibacteria group bacterium]
MAFFSVFGGQNISFEQARVFISIVLWRFLGLVQAFFSLRLALVFFDANPQTFVVAKLYAYTDIFIWPFAGIFPDIVVWGGRIDVSAIATMAGYCLALYLFEKFLYIFQVQLFT